MCRGTGVEVLSAAAATCRIGGRDMGGSTMPAFPAVFALSSLNGSNGFKIAAATDGSRAYTVSSAGDVNGNGFDDMIVGTPNADQNGSQSGASYVLFGKASGFSSDVELSSITVAFLSEF